MRYPRSMSALPTPQPFPQLTSEEFLEWELRQEDRHEYVGGRIVATAGNSEAHHVIAANTAFALRARIPKPCRATTERMVKIPNENWRFADVLVDCSGFDPKAWYAGEPRIAMEVESPSTSFLDEMQRLARIQAKWKPVGRPECALASYFIASDQPDSVCCRAYDAIEDYQAVPSIAHVLILAQDRARARLFTRTTQGWESADYTALDQNHHARRARRRAAAGGGL